MSKGDKFYKKVLDGAIYLDVEEFKKRLIAGIVAKMTNKSVA